MGNRQGLDGREAGGEPVIITAENYYSREANHEYMGYSQFKSFAGTMAEPGCEGKALAILNGEWEIYPSDAMLIGQYVDAHFEGTLGVFKAQHPEILKKDGELLSGFVNANEVIARIERDEYFMKFMAGEKQKIFVAEGFGCKWKCKLDSYLPGKCITDLKVMKSINETIFSAHLGRTNFVRFYGYDLQAFIYREIVRTVTGETLPFFIAAASKESPSDIAIIGFEHKNVPIYDYDMLRYFIEINIERVLKVKNGDEKPRRCEACDYCRATKVLSSPIYFMNLGRGK